MEQLTVRDVLMKQLCEMSDLAVEKCKGSSSLYDISEEVIKLADFIQKMKPHAIVFGGEITGDDMVDFEEFLEAGKIANTPKSEKPGCDGGCGCKE